ncbi:MAG: hypothetical protein LH610_12380 [Sphingomonas bacterium]|nr:hypothetical protein [Sphingomonas bacterium]
MAVFLFASGCGEAKTSAGVSANLSAAFAQIYLDADGLDPLLRKSVQSQLQACVAGGQVSAERATEVSPKLDKYLTAFHDNIVSSEGAIASIAEKSFTRDELAKLNGIFRSAPWQHVVSQGRPAVINRVTQNLALCNLPVQTLSRDEVTSSINATLSPQDHAFLHGVASSDLGHNFVQVAKTSFVPAMTESFKNAARSAAMSSGLRSPE